MVKVNKYDFRIASATITQNGISLPERSFGVHDKYVYVYDGLQDGLNDLTIVLTSSTGQVAKLVQRVCAGSIFLRFKLLGGDDAFRKETHIQVRMEEDFRYYEFYNFRGGEMDFYHVPSSLLNIRAQAIDSSAEGETSILPTKPEETVGVDMNPP